MFTHHVRHVLLSVIFFVTALSSTLTFAQPDPTPLTYPKVLTALDATLPKGWTKQTLIEKLIADVKRLKVDKPLTPDREDDLRQDGATDELIKVIRTNSPPVAATKFVSVGSGLGIADGSTTKNPIGMELVWIPPGEFMMGSNESDIAEFLYVTKKIAKRITGATSSRDDLYNEMPQHKVTLSEGFWFGKFEVTQAQWRTVTGDDPSAFKDCGPNCPVEQVNWDDIQLFLKKLNDKNDGLVYSLPTEAQWEYAARGGTTSLFPGRLSEMVDVAADNFGSETHPVGAKRPNPFGLYDMLGNVGEWCQDFYSHYSSDDASDPTGSDDGRGFRVVRSGVWPAWRIQAEPSARLSGIGFRVMARPR